MDREQWLSYMLGVMNSKGWFIPKDDVASFKEAFPEIPDIILEMATDNNGQN